MSPSYDLRPFCDFVLRCYLSPYLPVSSLIVVSSVPTFYATTVAYLYLPSFFSNPKFIEGFSKYLDTSPYFSNANNLSEVYSPIKFSKVSVGRS